jgi:hypothetical protein
MAVPNQTTGASTPFFMIDSFHLLRQQSLENIPRYLFRISDAKSPGTTTVSEVASAAAAAQGNDSEPLPDVFLQDRQKAARLLNAHLRWKCKRQPNETPLCNLVSWTSSLLVALQYGVYRHDYWQEALDEVRLLIVDTWSLGPGVFCRDMQIIDSYRIWEDAPGTRNLHRLWNLRNGAFCFGEYLSQGRITLRPRAACQITLGQLVGSGLFSICSGLSEQASWKQWANRVVELRQQYRSPMYQLQEEDLDTVRNIASLFEDFSSPMMVFLLGTCDLGLNDGGRLLYNALRAESVEGLECRDLGPDLGKMPELERCFNLLADLEAAHEAGLREHVGFADEDEDDEVLAQELENLGLGS